MKVARAGASATALYAAAFGALALPPLLGGPLWIVAAGAALCVVAAAIAVEDLVSMTIPDGYTLALAALSAAVSLAETGWRGLAMNAIDAIILTGCLLVAGMAYERLRGRSGLGFGDVKLLAASALLVGLAGVGLQLILAAAAALIFILLRALRRRRPLRAASRLPFGSFLAPALVLVWSWTA